jgi:hypothetical protein
MKHLDDVASPLGSKRVHTRSCNVSLDENAMNSSNEGQQRPLCDCGDPDCPGNVSYSWPFKLNAEYLGESVDSLYCYFSLRTTSWEWDGERTDLHDLISLLWAMLLRARDVASIQLIVEISGFGLDSEIYARILLPRQVGSIARLARRAYFEAMSAESHAARDMVLAIFGIPASGPGRAGDCGADYRSPPDWVAAARQRLRLPSTEGWEFNHRKAFDAKVFTCLKRGVTIAELGSLRITRLREQISCFRPMIADGVAGRAFRTSYLVNAVSHKLIKKAAVFLAMVEGTSSGQLIIPMDSHFVLVGQTALVALAAPCGAEVFENERIAIESRREVEAEVFLSDLDVIWENRLDDTRFESLVGELLTLERGVRRIRQVGATREADDGRDFLAEWSVPPIGEPVDGVSDGDVPLFECRDVIIQVKLRSRGVSRSDLPGLRDMLEHYRCSGLLVVAFPQVTTTLLDHLNELRRRGQFWVDWWGRAEIDQRLRRHPNIAARYTDLVQLRRPLRTT